MPVPYVKIAISVLIPALFAAVAWFKSRPSKPVRKPQDRTLPAPPRTRIPSESEDVPSTTRDDSVISCNTEGPAEAADASVVEEVDCPQLPDDNTTDNTTPDEDAAVDCGSSCEITTTAAGEADDEKEDDLAGFQEVLTATDADSHTTTTTTTTMPSVDDVLDAMTLNQHEIEDDGAAADESESDDSWDMMTDQSWIEEVNVNPLAQHMPPDLPGNFADHYHIACAGAQNAGKTTLVGLLRYFCHVSNNDDDTPLDLSPLNLVAAAALHAWPNANNRPTNVNDDRDPTPFRFDNLMLWDLPGGGTVSRPAEKYVEQMGLKYCSAVVVVVGTSESEVTNRIIEDLRDAHVPFTLVQTHADDLICKEWKKLSKEDKANTTANDFMETWVRKQRRYLRDRYELSERETVMVINADGEMPESASATAQIRADPLELIDCLSHVLNAARCAHLN